MPRGASRSADEINAFRDWRREHDRFRYYGYNHRGDYLVLAVVGIDTSRCTMTLKDEVDGNYWTIYYLELEPLEGVMLFAALAARPAAKHITGR